MAISAIYFTVMTMGLSMAGAGGIMYFTVDLQGYIDSVNAGEVVIYRRVETPVIWQDESEEIMKFKTLVMIAVVCANGGV